MGVLGEVGERVKYHVPGRQGKDATTEMVLQQRSLTPGGQEGLESG